MKYSQEASAGLIYAMQFVTMVTHLHTSVACVSGSVETGAPADSSPFRIFRLLVSPS